MILGPEGLPNSLKCVDFCAPANRYPVHEDSPEMSIRSALFTTVAAATLMLGITSVPATVQAQQSTAAVDIAGTDIGGVVAGPNGPEAGVWVIAETTELPTKFAKIVVTDDQGRFVIPDLPPRVNYEVWVRGYGLVDSPKRRASPGQQLSLTAVPAPNEAAAAHYFPALYWFTMLKLPAAKD